MFWEINDKSYRLLRSLSKRANEVLRSKFHTKRSMVDLGKVRSAKKTAMYFCVKVIQGALDLKGIRH